MSSNTGNPLGGRGKAAEDEWARRQDRDAIEKMKKKPTKQKGKSGGKTSPAGGDKGAQGKD